MCRLVFARILCSAFIFSTFSFPAANADAVAGGATQFVGIYNIVSPPPSGEPEYLVVDNGTLQEIWDKYADSPLPGDLVQYKDEMTILAGFTDRDFLILAFEALSTITDRYLKILGGDDDLLELLRRPEGRYDLGTRAAGQVQIYLLDPPMPLPIPVRKP